jgi:outer membrane autotransporter protein
MKSRIGIALRPFAVALATWCMLTGVRAAILPSDSTWVGGTVANPTDWNTASNWTPTGVPNSQTVQANFQAGAVNFTPMITGTAISVGSAVFGAGAPAYTITVTDSGSGAGTLDFYGIGVSNNSSSVQTFVVQSPNGKSSAITFHNASSAGNASFQISTAATLTFDDNSSAGSAFITNIVSGTAYASTIFNNSSTAGSATIVNSGPASVVSVGANTAGSIINLANGSIVVVGVTHFNDTSSAGNANITNTNGALTGFYNSSSAGSAQITNSTGGHVSFFNTAAAASATITNNAGGFVKFGQTATATNATTITNNAGGYLDISTLTNGGISIGQVAGAGNIYLGSNNLTTGGQNANATIGGVISDGTSPGNNFELPANLTGGSLTKVGTGTLTLTGANTYTGGTTVTGGLIDFASLSNFGAGNITLNGGGLQWAPGNTADVSGRLNPFGAAGATFDTNGNNVTLASSLTGAGSLGKQGAGALTLSGADTYTGNTTVSAGALYVNGSITSPMTTVNPGALLGGYGVIGGSVFNGGTVAPGDAPGTLAIHGNYTQSPAGALLIRIGGPAPAQHDLLAVGGTASLNGALQLVRLNNFQFNLGQTITFLTASGGVTGTFSSVSSSPTGTLVSGEVLYSSNSVSVVGVQVPFSSIARTPNEKAIAFALDSSLTDSRAARLISFLDHDSFTQALQALDQISPEALTSIYQIAFSQATQQTFNLQRRLADVRAGSNGFSAAGLTMNGGAATPAGGYEAAGPAGPDGKDGKSVFSPAPENRWGIFVTGLGEFASIGDTTNARGYDYTNAGFTLGVDYKVTPNFVIGLAAGYDYSSADLASGGRVIVDGGKFDLYSSYFTGKGFYMDAAVQGGYDGYDTSRAGLAGTPRGSTDGGEFTAIFGTGYDFKAGALTIGPTADFGYTYLGLGSFTERGSLAPLNFPDQHQESISSILGAKASYDWKIGKITVRPELRLGWRHEYGDATPGLISDFASGAGSKFLVHGPETGRDSLLAGAGFAILWSERFSTYVYYDGELARTNYEANNVTGGFRFEF